MMPIRLSLLTTFLVATAPAIAQESALPYLPADTIFAVSLPNLTESIQDFAKMPLAKMWAEEETQNFFADLKELAAKKLDELVAQGREMHAQGAFPINPDDILKLRVQSATVALTRAEIGMGDFGPVPNIGVVVHLNFGDSVATWHGLVAMGLSLLEAQAGDKVTKSETKVGEWQVRSLTRAETHGMKMGLHVAMVPNGLLIGTLLDDVTKVAENIQKKTMALGASAEFTEIAKRLDTNGAELVSFVRADPLVDIALQVAGMAVASQPQLQGVDMEGVVRALEAMGIRKLGFAGGVSKYVDGKSVQTSCHVWPGAEGKTAAPAKSVDTSFLKWVPKDAVGFSASTFDVASVYDNVVKGLQAYDPEFAKQALDHLSQMETQLGFKVREDLLGSFGDHYVSWSMPMGSIQGPPEWVWLLKVNDEQKLVTSLENLAKLTNGVVDISSSEKRGLKTWQMKVNLDTNRGMGGFNIADMLSVTPTFAFKNGYLVLGFATGDIKRAFQRMEREDDPKNDIRGNKEFAAVSNAIPAGVSSLSFTDWKANFEAGYQIVSGLLSLVPIGEEVPIDMGLLPDSGNLTKHLFGSIAYSKESGGVSESVSTGPFGMEVLVGIAAITVAAATAGVVAQGRF
ncbi:MAG: DUF3352 domain-containing protein [Planctomycetes bacterium]|nr:DUF3352 domain-containing protein [Planctomycetota bacterium]